MPSERPLFQYGIKLKDGWCPWRHWKASSGMGEMV